jgi:hypothetical protein
MVCVLYSTRLQESNPQPKHYTSKLTTRLQESNPQPKALHHQTVFGGAWPAGGKAKNQIVLKFGLWGHLTEGYICTKFQVNIAPAVTKHALLIEHEDE